MKQITLDIETTCLEPFNEEGRITVICAIASDENKFIACNLDEQAMITDFFNFLNKTNPSKIYGFNVGFDLRWIILRALKYNIKMPFDLRYRAVDLKRVLSLGEYNAKGKLSDYAVLLSLGSKLSDGKGAILLWENKEYDLLIDYCMQDVMLTKNLMLRMQEVGLL